jgi:phosphoglycerate dehydrogenase-like enzyme
MREDGAGLTLLVHSDRPEKFVAAIAARFPSLRIETCLSYEALAARLGDVAPQIVFSHKFEPRPYPGRVLVEAPSLRWVHVGGTGIEHLLPWDPARLAVTNSAGVPAEAMAEYALGAIYALNLGFPRFIRQQLARRWIHGSVRPTAGGTMTVIGVGRIGATLCRRARAAGLRVIGIRTRVTPSADADEIRGVDALEASLGESDYVVVVLPLTASTRSLLGASAFAALKPGAILVDMSRGGIVEHAALIAALSEGRLRGAALDVFEREPLPADDPLWSFDNVIMTPHVAGFIEDWERPVLAILLANLARFMTGAALENLIEPSRGY